MTEISIIVTCYNQERYIKECLDSILSQTFQEYEVIIVDDGSTDNSVKIISDYTEKYRNFKLIQQANQGVIIARNNGVKQATGKYIFPIDADDMIAETLLEKAYLAIKVNKGDVITCKVQCFGSKKGELYLEKPNKYHMAKNNCLVNAALCRKSDFDRAGGYDIAFAKGLEDYDLWLNMMYRLNLKFYRLPEILFFYRIKDNDEARSFSQYKFSAELKRIIYKKYPTMLFYLFLYKIAHFFIAHKIKSDKEYIKILGISFRINKKSIDEG